MIGRSGTGKSVLLKHVVGLLQPDRGTVRVNGIDVAKLDEGELLAIREQMGMLFQGGALFDSMLVGENVGLALREHTPLPERQIEEVVAEKLALVGLTGTEGQRPSSLSGGMKKRAALARSLAMNPKIMLYDEPTTGLDPITADVINRLIRRLQERLGMTSIAVTHDMVIAASPWGKIKTTLQVAAVIALIIDDPPHTATTVLVAAAVAATIWSGIDYFISARDVLRAPA